jgi:hypothetical protein
MLQFSTTVDSDFARLHGFDPESLAILIDLFPRVSKKANTESINSPPSQPRSSAVQDCYKLQYETAEKRYARMKGLVSASLETQRMLKLENQCLKAVHEVVRIGLEKEYPATLDAMLSSGDGRMSVSRSSSIASEVQSLASRLNDALNHNEKLMQFNRVMRGEQVFPSAISCHPDENVLISDLRQRIDVLTIETAAQRKRITELELECTRLQSDQNIFECDERLRECEDVFDKILGRDRLDYCAESIPGAFLSTFHPIGTCKNRDCLAYAKRLRGGLRKAVTAEYVRERNERLNGIVQCSVVPLETLRVEKDKVIETLQQRICRFEQTLRMTSEEADQVELRAVSSEIFKAASDLERIRFECGVAQKEYVKWGVMVSNLKSEFNAVSADLEDVRREKVVLSEEKLLIDYSRNQLATEHAMAVSHRNEVARFRDGRMGIVFQEKKAQLEALQREMEGMRMERIDTMDRVTGAMGVEMGPCFVQISEEQREIPLVGDLGSSKKVKRTASCFDMAPGVGLRMLCRCGEYVPFAAVGAHAQAAHSTGSRRILLCGAGCGHFVINGSRSDIEKHTGSNTCRQRLAEIQGLVSGFDGV